MARAGGGAKRTGKAKGAAVAAGERLIRAQTSSIGGGPQVQAPRKGSFDEAKRERFFERLLMTANIRDAARTAGVSVPTIWRWRKNDAEFRRVWEQTLSQAYADLEMRLIGRAMFGVEQEVISETLKDGRRRRRTRSDATGLGTQLLRAHAARVGAADMTAAAMLAGEAPPPTDAVIADLRVRLAISHGGGGAARTIGHGMIEQGAIEQDVIDQSVSDHTGAPAASPMEGGDDD